MNEGVDKMMWYKMCCKLEAVDEAHVILQLTAANVISSNDWECFFILMRAGFTSQVTYIPVLLSGLKRLSHHTFTIYLGCDSGFVVLQW